MRLLMLPNLNYSLLEMDIPVSIGPALPAQEQFRIVLDTLDSLIHSLDLYRQQFFLETIFRINEKRYHVIFNGNQNSENQSFWEHKNVGFMYRPKLIIQDLFTHRSHHQLLTTIRNSLLSESLDWLFIINQKETYIFTLSFNQYLLWSPIMTGLDPYFMASILLDVSVLEHWDDSSRWAFLEKGNTQLLRVFNQLNTKSSTNSDKGNSIVSRFLLPMVNFLIVQKMLLKNINSQMVSSNYIKKIGDFRKAFHHFSKIENELDFNFISSLNLELPELQFTKNIIENLTQDYAWILDIYPINFLEIMPWVENEFSTRESGGFFTPLDLAESIVSHSLKLFIPQMEKSLIDTKIFDPAMGTGILLVFALEWLVNFMISESTSDYSFIDLRNTIFQRCLYGNEINPESILIGSVFFKLFCMYRLEKPDMPTNLLHRNFVDFFITQVESKKSFSKYDVILSNPPYLAFHSRFTKKFPFKRELKSFRKILPIFSGKRDNTYLVFLGICLRYFLESNGVAGFVIDHSFLDLPSYERIRQFLLLNYHLHFILSNYHYKKTAVVDLAALIFSKRKNSYSKTLWQDILSEKPHEISTNHFLSQPNYVFRYKEIPNFFAHIREKSIPLGEIVTVTCGLEYGSLLKSHFLSSVAKEGFYPCIDGSNGLSQPYFLFWIPGFQNSFVRFDKEYEQYLCDSNQNISKTGKKVILISGNKERFFTRKIILRQTASKFVATLDDQQFLSLRNTHLILNPQKPYSLPLILGILNSSVGNWIGKYLNIIRTLGIKSSRYPQIRINDLKTFPLVDINKMNDNSLIPQLEEAVGECLRTGDRISKVLTKIWDVCEGSEVAYLSQRQFLRKCFNKDLFEALPDTSQLENVKSLSTILQNELEKLTNQKKDVDSIVFKIYNINQEDQQLFLEDKYTNL